MALIPTLSFCLNNSCTELIVSETTGAYNAISNLGGYGAPNPTTASVTTYTLVITDPDDITYTINLLSTTYFPTTDNTIEYSIPLTSLGNRTVIEDGYWQFAWTVSSNVSLQEFTAIGNSANYFTCNSECCVSALLANIDLNDDCCCSDTSSEVTDYLKAKVLLAGLKNAAFCGNLTLFDNIKTTLDRICAKTACRTCN